MTEAEFEESYLAELEADIEKFIKKKNKSKGRYIRISVLVLVLSVMAPLLVSISDPVIIGQFSLPDGLIRYITIALTTILAIGNGLLTFFRWSERWRDASYTYRAMRSAKTRYLFEKGSAALGSEVQRTAMGVLISTVEAEKLKEWTSFFDRVTAGKAKPETISSTEEKPESSPPHTTG